MNTSAMKWKPIILGLFVLTIPLLMFSCQEWGLWDDPSGNQKILDKTPQLLASYTFNEGLEGETHLYNGGTNPEIIDDATRKENVVYLNKSYLRFDNPLVGTTLANGASVTFWVRMSEVDTEGALFSFKDNNGGVVYFNGNSGIHYQNGSETFWVHNPASIVTNTFENDQWYFVAVVFGKTDFTIYVNGDRKFTASSNMGGTSSTDDFSFNNLLNFVNSAPDFYLGYGAATETKEAYYDNVKIYANAISSTEATPDGTTVTMPDPVYFNSFDATQTATIVGGGSYVPTGIDGFGTVFQNASGGTRQNYLLLPSDVLSHSADTKELSIGVWVNATNAGTSSTYMWSPLFTAYGAAPIANENTFPMFAAQYRGVLQVNSAGWCDFTDIQNVASVNSVYNDANDWLADKDWHYYTVTLTSTSAKVYFDGALKNEWAVDGTSDGSVISGLFTNGAALSYVCLGGNQAWSWGDPDPGFMFDDIAIYNKELKPAQINQIISEKRISIPSPVYLNTFDVSHTATIVGGGSFVASGNDAFGTVFQNTTGGMRQNYLLLPSDVLSHSSATNQMSIGVWVNASNAGASSTYMWSPLFTAYGAAPVNGENTFPMFAAQYRGVLQVNSAGWCDFTDAQNVAGVNGVYHDATDWLADHNWHYYTVTLTSTSAKVYFDGVLKNEWSVDGTSDGAVISGLFSNGSALSYICLGGNQAWSWGDPDPGFMFDDIAVYDVALTPAAINAIIANKQ